jgi:alpha-L-fucosidase
MNNLSERLVSVVPSSRQLKWHELKFYAFIHFGMNTFYNSEWGTGKEDPQRFNPTELDTDQWCHTLKEAGMKAVILTCKHHDGFCLWPSKYTEHSVKNSPYKDGNGDIVGEMAASCKKYGLKFGVYLSPWDMHEPCYGDSPKYNEYFVKQLTELLTQYGEIFSVWFDGACGEGPNGKKQEYDWELYHQVIREHQPDAVAAICGEDVRWCGNEAGHCRKAEWNVVPRRLSKQETIAENSQQEDNTEFRERPITPMDQDLGSREVLKDEKDLIWYPAEVDTSIRPGWFYHESENDHVKPLEKLIEIFYNSTYQGKRATKHKISFTLAHELSHSILHANEIDANKGFLDFYRLDDEDEYIDDDKEVEANTLAGEILLPRNTFTALFKTAMKEKSLQETKKALSEVFDVSLAVIDARIKYLKLENDINRN